MLKNYSIDKGCSCERTLILRRIKYLLVSMRQEYVCPICFKFLSNVYTKDQMKRVKLLSIDESKERSCHSLCHKKLTDGIR